VISRIGPKSQFHEESAPTLEVEGVSFSYDSKPVLEDISFSLVEGARLAVVGPNASGKSTLFKLIAGILRPTSGSIRIYGHEPGRHICIGYVPQYNDIDWSFPVTVSDVVMMGRTGRIGLLSRPSRGDRDLVMDCLRQVGLDGLANRQIGQLSGGQRQRAFIARSLAQEAELLLLDEPLTGLDVPSYEAILKTLDGVRGQNVAVMVATHDLNLASKRFDLVMLLNRRMIALGKPEEALTSQMLLQAYGGQIHVLSSEGDSMVLADTCRHGREERA
jgi:ABC-type Mn2+/Zn2+ transport system ATPase subunit